MADGKLNIPYNTFIGYDKGEDGNLVVNPEQVKTIRLIFGDFIAGLSCHTIAEKLTWMDIKTSRSKNKWSQTTVKSILMNEKYKGDALLQKYYTPDFLTEKQVLNGGEIPQYYVEGTVMTRTAKSSGSASPSLRTRPVARLRTCPRMRLRRHSSGW